MNIDSYGFETNKGHLDYEFESEGPRGIIKKVARLDLINVRKKIYNLAFGDLNEETGEISDTSVSNIW